MTREATGVPVDVHCLAQALISEIRTHLQREGGLADRADVRMSLEETETLEATVELLSELGIIQKSEVSHGQNQAR